MVKKVKDLCGRLMVVPGDDALSKEAQRNATFMFLSLVRSQLATKRLLKVRGGGGRQGRTGEDNALSKRLLKVRGGLPRQWRWDCATPVHRGVVQQYDAGLQGLGLLVIVHPVRP